MRSCAEASDAACECHCVRVGLDLEKLLARNCSVCVEKLASFVASSCNR